MSSKPSLGDQPAFPTRETDTYAGAGGMSTRTWLAGQAMKGLIAQASTTEMALTFSRVCEDAGITIHEGTASGAIFYADALLAELEKPA